MRGPCLPYTLAIIISLLLVLGIAACGGDEDEPVAVVTTPDPTPTAVPTTVAEVTPTEQPATPEAATPSPEATQAIPNEADNLAQHAGGPGATFVGDPHAAGRSAPARGSDVRGVQRAVPPGGHGLADWRRRQWEFRAIRLSTQATTTKA